MMLNNHGSSEDDDDDDLHNHLVQAFPLHLSLSAS